MFAFKQVFQFQNGKSENPSNVYSTWQANFMSMNLLYVHYSPAGFVIAVWQMRTGDVGQRSGQMKVT